MCVFYAYLEPARRTPLKHMLGHVKGTLPVSGHLLRMLPNSPKDGQPATVELEGVTELLAHLLQLVAHFCQGIGHGR